MENETENTNTSNDANNETSESGLKFDILDEPEEVIKTTEEEKENETLHDYNNIKISRPDFTIELYSRKSDLLLLKQVLFDILDKLSDYKPIKSVCEGYVG